MDPQFGQTIGHRFEQRMGQAQIQSLDMLAMPVEELRERIAEELRENPALELSSSSHTAAVSKNNSKVHNNIYEGDSAEETVSYRGSGATAAAASDSFQAFLENIPEPYANSLQSHLLEQLHLQKLDALTVAFAERIIGNLNDDGFHEVPISELFAADLNPATATKSAALVRRTIHRALSIVRRLEPIGCAVKDFKQSMLVQAKIFFQNRKTEPIYVHTIDIIEHHFEYLEKARPASLVRAINEDRSIPYKLSQQEAEQILLMITSLNPFPGKTVPADAASAGYIIPTAFVDQTNGEFSVKMNDFEIPLLCVSPQFQAAEASARNADEQRYIKDHIHKARVFIGSLDHRERTISDVVQKIVLAQEAFFLTGDKQQLIPLTQQQIAEALNVHESTISRTVAGKYLQCKWGIFEMRFFFTNSVTALKQRNAAEQKASGTKEGTKECIKELLAAYPEADGKLSDQKISDLLQEHYGVSVARRTVAKYRKELAIGSSYDRP